MFFIHLQKIHILVCIFHISDSKVYLLNRSQIFSIVCDLLFDLVCVAFYHENFALIFIWLKLSIFSLFPS